MQTITLREFVEVQELPPVPANIYEYVEFYMIFWNTETEKVEVELYNDEGGLLHMAQFESAEVAETWLEDEFDLEVPDDYEVIDR